LTQPTITSSTWPGSTSTRANSPDSVWPSSSTACRPDSAPPGFPLPIGLRTASTMTASRMGLPPLTRQRCRLDRDVLDRDVPDRDIPDRDVPEIYSRISSQTPLDNGGRDDEAHRRHHWSPADRPLVEDRTDEPADVGDGPRRLRDERGQRLEHVHLAVPGLQRAGHP